MCRKTPVPVTMISQYNSLCTHNLVKFSSSSSSLETSPPPLFLVRIACRFSYPVVKRSAIKPKSAVSMDSRQGGIQMLLSTEQEAQQIVASAKNFKTTRLRQAKEEADREAVLYRAHLEAEHERKVAETTGYSGSNVKRLEEETGLKIQGLKDVSSRVSSDVVDMLMKYVTNV